MFTPKYPLHTKIRNYLKLLSKKSSWNNILSASWIMLYIKFKKLNFLDNKKWMDDSDMRMMLDTSKDILDAKYIKIFIYKQISIFKKGI